MSSAAFYSPLYKAPTVKLPSFQSGANAQMGILPSYAQQQSIASIPGLPKYAAANPFTSTAFKVPGSTTVNQGGYPYTTIPIRPGGPSSNTAGGGATITDVNSGNPNYTPGDSAYAPSQQTTIDQNYMHRLMASDPTLAAELDSLALQNQQSWSNFLTSAQQAEIAYGGGYNPTSAANQGFNAAGFGARALTNIIPGSPDYTHGLALPQGSLMDALSDPRILAAIDPSNPSSGYGVSALGQIAYQLKQANNAASANLRARGMYSSGALGQHLNENLYQNSVASNTALNNFLSALQGGYGTYLTDFGGAQTSQQADVNQTLQNIISGIGAGLYTLPSSAPNNPGGDTPGFPNPPPVTSPGWGPANDMNPDDFGGGPFVPIPQTGTVLDQARTLSQAYITPAVTKKYNLSPGIGNWAT